MVNVTPIYQLFITNSDGITTSNVTSNDYIDLSLQLDSEYNITLVATGETLPSDILTVTVPQGIVISIIIIINFLHSCQCSGGRTSYNATESFICL